MGGWIQNGADTYYKTVILQGDQSDGGIMYNYLPMPLSNAEKSDLSVRVLVFGVFYTVLLSETHEFMSLIVSETY